MNIFDICYKISIKLQVGHMINTYCRHEMSVKITDESVSQLGQSH